MFDAVMLPPDGFKTPDSRVWLLFAALLLSGAAVAELAARERRRSEQAYEREREAALLAGLSSALVGGASLELAQVDAARVAAAAIGAPAARIVLGRGPLAGQVALPLDVDGRVIGRLELMGADAGGARRRDRPARRALAGGRAGARAGARAARARRRRGRGAARVRRAQDGAPARRLARAAHAADGDQGRRGRTARRSGAARRGGRARAARGRQHRDRPPRPPRLRPARRLAPAGRARASTALDWCEVDDLLRGAVAAARSRAPGTHGRDRGRRRAAARALRRLADRARARQPDRERRQVLARRRARLAARPCGRGRSRRDHRDRPRARHRARSARARVRAVLPRARRRRRRHGPRARDRARIRRGQRRHAHDRRCSRWRHVHAHRAAEPEGQRGGPGVSGSGARVLVVDDERAIQRALKATLEAAGYHVDVVGTCADALAQVALKPPDLVLLDLLLPDGTGDEVAREIRTWSNVPILLVSAVGDEREKVKALDAGADDYVTKPFGIDELLARVRAMLRRAVDRPRPDAVVELGEPARRPRAPARRPATATEIHLTPIEYDLLRTLVAHPGKVLTHKAIIQEVWGPGLRREPPAARPHRRAAPQDRARSARARADRDGHGRRLPHPRARAARARAALLPAS